MSEKAGPRPRQVTVAGVMATAACVLLVISLFDAMSTVRSAAVREDVADFLSKPPGDGLGLDVAGVVDLLRGVVLFSGALAAAGAVLAVYALQRHRGARIGLTVTAILLMLFTTFVSGFLPILVAVGAAMMWGREARDWFAGRAAAPPPAPSSAAPQGMTSWQPRPDERPAPDASSPTAGWSGPHPQQPQRPAGPQAPAEQPAPWGQPFAQPPAYLSSPPSALHGLHTAPVRADARPPSVVWAAWLTWVGSALAAFSGFLVVVTILADHEGLVEELQRNAAVADQGWSARQILGFVWITVAVLIAWSLASAALGWLVWRRVELGRVLLVVSAVGAAFFGLVAVPVGWVHAAAAIATVVLLSRRSTRDWFARRSTPSGPPPPPRHDPYAGPSQPPRPQGKPPVW